MSDAKKSSLVTPKKPTVSKESLLKHLDDVAKYLEEFKGKVGFNPYFPLNKITALRDTINNSETLSDTLIKEVNSLEKVEPKV